MIKNWIRHSKRWNGTLLLLFAARAFQPKQKHERSLALRYKGQSFELEIKQTGANLAASFHRAHRERYGYAQESNIVEIVSARVRSTGIVEKLAQRRSDQCVRRALRSLPGKE